MQGWTEGQTDGQMNGQTDLWIRPIPTFPDSASAEWGIKQGMQGKVEEEWRVELNRNHRKK